MKGDMVGWGRDDDDNDNNDDDDDDGVGDAGDVVERHDSLIFDFCSATEKGEIIHGSKNRETAGAGFVRKF